MISILEGGGPEGKTKRVYDYVPLQTGYPGLVRIYDPGERKDSVGWAFVIGDDELGCLLVDIYVEEKWRRKGFGTDLLKILQNQYKRIWTGMSTKEGRELCLKMGFKLNKGHFDRDIPKLEWEAPCQKPSKKN